MLGSSIFAFYLPCFVMLVTYGYIFYTLRKRLRAIQLQVLPVTTNITRICFPGNGRRTILGLRRRRRQHHHVSHPDRHRSVTSIVTISAGIAPKNRNMISWEKPLLRKIEETAAEHASSLNESEREQVKLLIDSRPILSCKQFSKRSLHRLLAATN